MNEMALMKCPDCGRKVSHRASVCPECGCPAEYFEESEKVEFIAENCFDIKNINPFVSGKENDFRTNEYAAQIRTRIVETYIHNIKYDASEFYGKAQFYEMTTEAVDQICDGVADVIKKLNLYLDNLHIESHGLSLSVELLREFKTYGRSLGINEEILDSFNKLYERENKIVEKRAYLEAILQNYAETGKIEAIYEDTVCSEELFKEYQNRILEAEQMIAAEYTDEAPIDFTESEMERLGENAKKYHFVNDDIKALMKGFEIKRGIFEKRLQISKEYVLKQLDEKYSKIYKIFNERQIKFESKYFISKELWKIAHSAQELFAQDIEKIDNKDSDICKLIEEIFEKYTENLAEDVKRLEKLLNFSICKELREEISNNNQLIWSKIGDLELDLEEIVQNRSILKSERTKRKSERGIWSGAGTRVAETIKEVAAEGAKNVVSGMTQIGASIVGNVALSIVVIVRRNKEIQNFYDSIKLTMELISNDIYNECKEVVDDYYPELCFECDYHDTQEERNMRKRFRRSVLEREEKAIELLLKNPYNPLNGFTVRYECMINHKDLWSQNTAETFEILEKIFGWKECYPELCSEIGEKVIDILEKDAEDQISDESVIDDYAEILDVFEYMMKAGANGRIEKSYLESRNIYKILLDKQEYVYLLNNIYHLSTREIIEKGEMYCQRNEFSRAQKIYIKGLKNNPTAKSIIEYFFEAKNKEKMLEILERYVDKKSSIKPKTYEDIMSVLAKIKNKEGKTLLMYASELSNYKLAGELIRYNADVNVLDEPMEETGDVARKFVEEGKSVVCKSCGNALTETAKFCKFCGKKVE